MMSFFNRFRIVAADQADSPNVANNRSELSFDKVSKTESENQSFGDECSNKVFGVQTSIQV